MSDPLIVSGGGALGGGSPLDDNGFEKVQHADISPSSINPPPVGGGTLSGGVENLYGSGLGGLGMGGDTQLAKPLIPTPVVQPVQAGGTTVHISSGVTGTGSPTSISPLTSSTSLGGLSGPIHGSSASSGSVSVAGSRQDEPKPASGAYFGWVKNLDPRVLDLIYWRDIKKTGAVFGSLLILLLSLALFSVLSVVAYLSLIILTITVTFRLYKNVMSAVQKTGEGNPFKSYLEMDISLSDDKVQRAAEELVKCFIRAVNELKRLFLVEDMVDSLKFGLILWVLTYVGAWFNGMTLIIIAVVDIFTLPKVYETYKVQIDQYLELAKTKIQAVIKQVQEKLPVPGKKKQA